MHTCNNLNQQELLTAGHVNGKTKHSTVTELAEVTKLLRADSNLGFPKAALRLVVSSSLLVHLVKVRCL